MEITFSAPNTLSLSLLSCTSLSSSLSPPKLVPVRRQFLGCSRKLRSSSLQSRRKLGFHAQSSRFLVEAKFNSGTVIVYVAVAALSVISIAYFAYSKRKKNSDKVPGHSKHTLGQRGKSITNDTVPGQFLVLEDLDKGKSQVESEHVTTRVLENSQAIEDSEAPLQVHESDLTNNGTFVNNVPKSHFADAIASSICDSESDSKLYAIAEHVTPENSHAELSELEKPNQEIGEEVESTGYNGSFGHPVREELHTLSKKPQQLAKSISSLNAVRTTASNAYILEGSMLTSLMREYVETEAAFAHWKDVSFYNGRESDKRGFGEDIGIIIFPQKSKHFSYQNGLLVSKKHNLSEQMSAYNRLIRDGRLIDCLELLEDMERMNLLDMNKVYHSRFFGTCKNKKAVKEAFRFTKLISNPTLSTFNMLMSVCASSQDSEGAFQVLRLARNAGLKADCKLYTTLIDSCAKSGKVDAMFEVFHEMVNAKVEPNTHTYGALINGCGRAGQVAKAFGAYGILRSKNVKPDRIVFNALITACGQSGAVDRAFDVLSEMRSEIHPIDPDHITVGALITACASAGQIDRAKEVYKMMDQYNIKGTPEVYTIAVRICSQNTDWKFARNVFNDMMRKGVIPDEILFSALVDAAGYAGELDAAFEVMRETSIQGIHHGIVAYSSLMGACSNANNWEKALELYEDLKSRRLKPTVSTMNALLTALCNGGQLQKAMEVLSQMKKEGLCANTITYSILVVASEKKNDLEAGLVLLSGAKEDGVAPNLLMSRCLISMCLRRFEKACTLGEHVLTFDSGRPQIDTEWTSLALMIYRETIVAGMTPSMETFSEVLGCLRLPHEGSLRNRLIENLGVTFETSSYSKLSSLINGFGEYDPRAFSLLEEASSLGILPCVSLIENPIVLDVRNFQIPAAEVYLLTVLKGLKNRQAAGARLPNISIKFPIEKTTIQSPNGQKTVNLAGRIGQAVGACLRRLGLPYQGSESFGKIRINGLAVKRWLKPKLCSPFSGIPAELSSSQSRLAKGITDQQRDIRTGNFCLEGRSGLSTEAVKKIARN